jgi:hypothetical protein
MASTTGIEIFVKRGRGMKKSLISAAVFFVHASAVGLCLNVSSRLLAADEEARLANPSGPVLADLWRPFPCSVVSRASEFRHECRPCCARGHRPTGRWKSNLGGLAIAAHYYWDRILCVLRAQSFQQCVTTTTCY